MKYSPMDRWRRKRIAVRSPTGARQGEAQESVLLSPMDKLSRQIVIATQQYKTAAASAVRNA